MNKKDYTTVHRHAIVMGATSGIGREVALLLAEKGWHVAVAGRRADCLEELALMHENIKVAKSVDINAPGASTALEEMAAELGGMDLYVHSSGIGWQNEALEQEKELMTVETNASGFTRMVSAAFKIMAREGKGGHIACISSIAGTKGLGAAPAYSATKRFQAHYMECLAQLSHKRGLHIIMTDIRPGFVDTPLIAGSDYPLKLSAAAVAADIVKAIKKKKGVCIIDWRYKLLVMLWRLIPRWMWVRMKI